MTAPRLLVLGAGRHQAALIARAEARGIHTIALDPFEDAPGKRLATTAVVGDAFSADDAERAARAQGADGVITVGTDQTVASMAAVAERLGLPCGLSAGDALKATHKRLMRAALTDAKVPMAKGWNAGPDQPPPAPTEMTFPVIVKPADSQGQRGTTKVHDAGDLDAAIADARSHSRTDSAVIEEFLTGPEITINAWVSNRRAIVLAVTDRVTVNPPPNVGICLRHIFPSRHAPQDGESAVVAQRTADAYGVVDGPLYIQAIASENGLRVLEAAARVGGGHEMSLIPATVGVELIDRSIDVALGRPVAEPEPRRLAAGLINFIVARPGRITDLVSMTSLVSEGLIDEGAWYKTVPFDQPAITDSMGRIGYFMSTGPTREEVVARSDEAYARLQALDASGTNLVFWPGEDQLLGG